MKRAPGFISCLAAGLALTLIYFAVMWTVGGWYYCDDKAAFLPLAPPIAVCRR
jgi:hypothetical protein